MDKAGYLRDFNGGKRLRIVDEGHDPDDESVPMDAVRFDSESDGMASFLEMGTASIPQGANNFIAVTSGTWIRTWSYGFAPLCLFFFNPGNTGWQFSIETRAGAGTTGTVMQQPQIRVSTAGIWVRGAFPKTTGVTFQIQWVALRVPAT